LYVAAISVENRVLLTINSDKTIVDLQIYILVYVYLYSIYKKHMWWII